MLELLHVSVRDEGTGWFSGWCHELPLAFACARSPEAVIALILWSITRADAW